jgi:F-type H+-transporting ATPase subunit alpha
MLTVLCCVVLLMSVGCQYIVVVADETSSYGMQYLAPFAGSTAASYFRDNGMDVLIVYDDLGAHGQDYVNMSR